MTPSSRVVSKLVRVPTAPGELLDRITILAIKSRRISDEAKLRNVRRELQELSAICSGAVPPSAELTALTSELRSINERLWDVEDEIRACEARGDFGLRFIELARTVYVTNDRRSAVKRKLNLLLGSRFLEEKQYGPHA